MTEEITVNVRFKGSKLSVGKISHATVTADFLSCMTALNHVVLGKLPTSVYDGVDDDHQRANGAEVVNEAAQAVGCSDLPPKEVLSSPLSSSSSFLDERVEGAVATLTLAPPSVPARSSIYYPDRNNANKLAKLLNATDPADMDINTCYDLWLWFESLNHFAPLTSANPELELLELENPYEFSYLNMDPELAADDDEIAQGLKSMVISHQLFVG